MSASPSTPSRRWKRFDGFDVLFITGMDEHGQKMQRTAEREATPQQLADRTAAQFERMGEALNARADELLARRRRAIRRRRSKSGGAWSKGDIFLSK